MIHPRALLTCGCCPAGLGQGLKGGIFNKFLGDSAAMGHLLNSEAIEDLQAGSRHLFAQGEASKAFFRSFLWRLGHHTDIAAVLEKGLPTLLHTSTRHHCSLRDNYQMEDGTYTKES